jgi:hypothetical protein
MLHAYPTVLTVRLHNDTIMSPLHPTIPTHAIACATLRETTGCPSKRPETEQHYAERIRTQVPSKWSEYLGLGTLRTRMITMLRHSRRSKLSSNRNPIYSHQLIPRLVEVSPALKAFSQKAKRLFLLHSQPSSRHNKTGSQNNIFMLTINIPSFPTTSILYHQKYLL